MFGIGKDRDAKMGVGIGLSLAVMSSFIFWVVLSFIFSDIDMSSHKSDIFVLWLILTITPFLLMLKAYHSEYPKNYQHPFFSHKSENVKSAIFATMFIIIAMQLRW